MGSHIAKNKVKIGPFKMGWCMVMFDLPVVTRRERKIATGFRNALLDDGYTMLQYSVYCRFCHNYERMKKHANRIEIMAPMVGNIRAFFITDKQWEQCITIMGADYALERNVSAPQRQQVLEFW